MVECLSVIETFHIGKQSLEVGIPAENILDCRDDRPKLITFKAECYHFVLFSFGGEKGLR